MAQPSAYEQYMLELVNRARLDPSAEGNLHGVSDLNAGLTPGTITTDAKQPLVFNSLLIDSARSHSQWMLDTDTFSHTGINNTSSHDRMTNAGYQFIAPSGSGENIAYKGTTGTVNEISFVEGNHSNLFKSSGHRKNILKENYRELGIGILEGIFTAPVENPNYYPEEHPNHNPDEPEFIDVDFNTQMVTQNFAYSGSDIFLTGVAYDDLVTDDSFYTVGEGLSGIDITAVNTSNGNSYNTTTMTAGGYQIALPTGTYNVTFTESGQNLGSATQITIDSENIKLDLDTSALVDLSGDDSLDGDNNDNSLFGENGNDTLKGFNGNDYLDGGNGNDKLYGHDGNDTLIGGADTDSILEFSNANLILTDTQLTGRGVDIISQIELAELYGGNSNNLLDASDATQIKVTLKGGSGDDTLLGGDKNDFLVGFHDNDSLKGNIGNDLLHGQYGQDTLDGGEGDDSLNGGEGDDVLIGGIGIDCLLESSNSDMILTDSQLTGRGNDTISGIEKARLYAGSSDNTIDASGANQISITIKGGSGNNLLKGGAKNDFLVGRDGNDTLQGGNDNDFLSGGSGDDVLWGGNGDDTLTGDAGADIFALESGKDSVIIRDFSDGSDLLGLTGSLSFTDFNIVSNSGGTATIVRDLTNNNAILAVISDVAPGDLTPSDFTTL